MPKLTEDESKLLDAISTLKRITGTPGSPTRSDSVSYVHGTNVQVHTTEYHESAIIMANLLSQSLLSLTGHTEKFWNKRDAEGNRMRHGFHDDVRIITDEIQGRPEYRISCSFPPADIPDLTKKSLKRRNSSFRLTSLAAPDRDGSQIITLFHFERGNLLPGLLRFPRARIRGSGKDCPLPSANFPVRKLPLSTTGFSI